MIEAFDHLLGQTRPAFTQQRTFERARVLALNALVGLGRRTISGLLCASNSPTGAPPTVCSSLCTDPNLPLDQLMQAYLWRWEIELNFRDEKTLLGTGEAQVRTVAPVESVPALVVASYAFMLLAGHAVTEHRNILPLPKWRRQDALERCSTARLQGLLRTQLWATAMGVNSHHFAQPRSVRAKLVLFENTLPDAVCHTFR